MIDRKQFLGLMAGAPILMRAGMAEAVELPDARMRLTLVVDTVVRDENGNEKEAERLFSRQRAKLCLRTLWPVMS